MGYALNGIKIHSFFHSGDQFVLDLSSGLYIFYFRVPIESQFSEATRDCRRSAKNH
jgi:hypothetical protein